jgi:hypothetical protein
MPRMPYTPLLNRLARLFTTGQEDKAVKLLLNAANRDRFILEIAKLRHAHQLTAPRPDHSPLC